MDRHGASALAVARWLAGHDRVTKVHHPAFQPASSSAPAATDEVQSAPGPASGLFSVELAEPVDIKTFCNALSLFRLGVSWGGHESLAFPAMIGLEQAGGDNALHAFEVSSRLVRLSIGLEDPGDLIQDLQNALDIARAG
jgi:cystathionine beta-lyase/cystathionine gamma-synthase